jgi:UrcA family protein
VRAFDARVVLSAACGFVRRPGSLGGLTMQRKPISSRFLLSAAGVLALALSAGPVFAQDYRPYDNAPRYDRDTTETVEVYAYRHPPRTSRGGEIIHASYSAPVRADDLDLTTYWGAHVFRARVVSKAHEVCEILDTRYPVGADAEDSGPVDESACYRRARAQGLEDADAAIDHARRYADRDR